MAYLPSTLTPLVLALALASPAAAQSRRECATHFEEGQTQRAERDFMAAKRDFMACSQLSCPKIIVAECVQFLSELEKDIPTISFRVTADNGEELFNVDVVIDDEPLTQKIDGGTFEVNPGVHELRFSAPGFRPRQTRASVNSGERGRVIEVELVSEKSAELATKAGSKQPGFHVPVVSIVAAGAGLVGLAGFGYFRLTGSQRYDELRRSCAGACSDDAVASVRQKYVLSSASLALGSVALVGAGLSLWLLQPGPSPESAALALELRPTGAALRSQF
jgi:hypothetical protein